MRSLITMLLLFTISVQVTGAPTRFDYKISFESFNRHLNAPKSVELSYRKDFNGVTAQGISGKSQFALSSADVNTYFRILFEREAPLKKWPKLVLKKDRECQARLKMTMSRGVEKQTWWVCSDDEKTKKYENKIAKWFFLAEQIITKKRKGK